MAATIRDEIKSDSLPYTWMTEAGSRNTRRERSFDASLSGKG
jgi:hypothetical protein